MDPTRFGLAADEVGTDQLSVAGYLVVHPSGVLVFDTGAVPDDEWTPTGRPVRHRVRLPDGAERDLTLRRGFGEQLVEAGVHPGAVTHLALSHYHYDHTANAAMFPNASWLVRTAERDAMFAVVPPAITRPTDYARLRAAPTMFIEADEHDVFGDGTVVLKAAAGHTPGHQVLLVRLAQTGPVLLSGDLYHYPQERTLDRVPTFESDPVGTRETRRVIDAFLETTGAALWIGHDAIADAARRKVPDYYA